VLSAGTGKRGAPNDVRIAMTAPGRLILAESFNRGRRATCDGKDLDEPTVGGGFGTAWRVPASCREVTIGFAPNRLVNAGYAVSIVVAALLLVLLIAGRRRIEVSRAHRGIRDEIGSPVAVGRAALIAVPAGLAFGFVFAARATPLFVLGTFLVLYRGIGARPLALAGGAVIGIAVPVLTLIIRPENRGGYNPEYAIDRIAVHWVAVAGVALFVLALSRAMGRPARGRAAPPSAGAPPGRAP
jgi:hypothetical protein